MADDDDDDDDDLTNERVGFDVGDSFAHDPFGLLTVWPDVNDSCASRSFRNAANV